MHLPRIQPYREARRELAEREAKEALHAYWRGPATCKATGAGLALAMVQLADSDPNGGPIRHPLVPSLGRDLTHHPVPITVTGRGNGGPRESKARSRAALNARQW